jgi:hypothetical protein
MIADLGMRTCPQPSRHDELSCGRPVSLKLLITFLICGPWILIPYSADFRPHIDMLFDKARKYGATGGDDSNEHHGKPLSCTIFFFASQMSRNLEEVNSSSTELTNGATRSSARVHRLDTLLSQIQLHADRSPYVTRFEAVPVEMAPPGRPQGTSREEMHDTLLFASFKSKRAWENWIQTPEWQQFMQSTEKEGVFRRIPHVACAHSLKGLRNPLEVLMA